MECLDYSFFFFFFFFYRYTEKELEEEGRKTKVETALVVISSGGVKRRPGGDGFNFTWALQKTIMCLKK